MNRDEQLQLFGDKLDALYNWAVDELDLDYASIIGVMHLKTASIANEALEDEDDEEDSTPKFK